MTTWRALLLIYPELEVRLPLGGIRRTPFRHALDDAEIAIGRGSFAAFPPLVAELTDGNVNVAEEVQIAERPLRSLSALNRQHHQFWPSPDDVREELEQFAGEGNFDSLFVYWPQNNFATGASIPSGGWGLGMGASSWSYGMTYATVANAPRESWEIPRAGEVWLHEWLHGVCAQYRARGHSMPDGDADGAERHGYVRSAENGWMDYYRDLMHGTVRENGSQTGIPLVAWNEKPFDRDGDATAVA